MSDDEGVVEPPQLRNSPMPSRSAMGRWLVGVMVVGLVGLSLAGLAGRAYWLLDLCNHFRFQYAAVLGLTTVGLALLRSRRMVWVSLAGCLLNAALVLPLYTAVHTDAEPGGSTLVVMQFNINTANRDFAGVIEEVLASGAGVVFVQEVDQLWLDALEDGLDGYALVLAEPRNDNFGIACFVAEAQTRAGGALVIASSRVFDITGGVVQVPVIELEAALDGRPISILSLHPLPPVSAPYARLRDASLQAAGVWAAEQDVPVIVVGDLNATPWSTALIDLQSSGGLVNSQAGFGRSPTWPDGLFSLGMIPIDHLLHGEALTTLDRAVGRGRGSDHRPLVVRLAWAEQAGE